MSAGVAETARAKLKRRGAASLTDDELLQAIVGSGGAGNGYRQIARRLNAAIQSVGHERMTFGDAKAVKGVGDAKAAALMASMEFCRRRYEKRPAPLIDTPERAAEQMRHIKDKKQEHFVMLTLDGARRLIKCRTITIGTLTASLVHPREVFAPAIEDRAASIVIGHNHPSGMLDVSELDRAVTRLIKEAGELVGIKLDDHLVVAECDGGYSYVSAL